MDSEPAGCGRKNILIVDDDPVIRRIVCRKLSAQGYHCEEADSAELLFDKLSNNSFELVILDMRMPARSGVQLLPETKAD